MKAIVICSALLLAGCASNYSKAGMTNQQLEQDKVVCEYEAQKATQNRSPYGMGDAIASGIDDGLRINNLRTLCMHSKGYSTS